MADRTIQPGTRELPRLLPAPHVALQFLAACQDLGGATADLREIVLQDSTLCARILDAAVRTRPGRLDPADPLRSALEVLPAALVRSIALQSARALVDASLDPAATQFLRELWFRSQAMGALARGLAEAIACPDAEEARLAGLLLNLGMLALFSARPESYPATVGTSAGGPAVRGAEQAAFQTDHCRLAAELAAGWELDSFLAEALRYPDHEAGECREAATLVRIARVTRELARRPLEFDPAAAPLAADLLGLGRPQLEAAFARALEHYRPLAPFDGREEECHRELERVRRRLTSLAFGLADREGLRQPLGDERDHRAAVAAARPLYLFHATAREAVFFVADPGGERFAGLAAPGQSRRIGDLATPLAADNLLAGALRRGRAEHSFGREPGGLALFDRQLASLCGTPGFACLPLRHGERTVGGVVLGLASREAAEGLGQPLLHHLGSALARALAGGPAGARDDLRLRKLAHEIRTPLAVVANYMKALEMLLAETDQAAVVQAVAGEIRRIGDLVSYHGEAPAQSREEERPAATPPEELVRGALEALGAALPEGVEAQIVTDCDPAAGPLAVNPVLVRQILVNLLKNAVEALPDGGRVTVATREQRTADGGRQVLFSVEDDGPGIPPAVLESLFSPVATTKGAGHSGLGLNIVKGMADDLGGRISCQSGAGRGTRFDLVIPRPAGPGREPQNRRENRDGD